MREKKELILSYIKANVSPILVDFLSGSELENAIVLPANIDVSELNGHYEGTEFVPPKWYNDLTGDNENIILVIDKIDTIPKEEQKKFIELLEYRQVSTFELPTEYVLIVTANNINKDVIDEEIFSLVARI